MPGLGYGLGLGVSPSGAGGGGGGAPGSGSATFTGRPDSPGTLGQTDDGLQTFAVSPFSTWGVSGGLAVVSSPGGQSVAHVFAAGGTMDVTLNVIFGATNVSLVYRYVNETNFGLLTLNSTNLFWGEFIGGVFPNDTDNASAVPLTGSAHVLRAVVSGMTGSFYLDGVLKLVEDLDPALIAGAGVGFKSTDVLAGVAVLSWSSS